MALDLSASSLIRSGSGLLLLLLGIAFAVIARRGVEKPLLTWGLALFGVGSGVAFIAVNLAGEDPTLAPAAIMVNLLSWFAADAGLLLVLAWTQPRGASRIAIVAAVLASIVGWGWAAITLDVAGLTGTFTSFAPSAHRFFPLDLFAYEVGWSLALLNVAALGIRYATHPAERGALVLLATGLVAYPAFIKGSGAFDNLTAGGVLGQAVVALTLLAIVVVWLRATSIAPRPARVVAPVAMLSWLLGMFGGTELFDAREVVGYLRIAGVVLIVVALLKYDLLGAGLTTRSIRRGTLATGALAALFVVAQIAQNFLSDTYGLVMGGVVAGAFLFAAQPLQRAMERLTAPGAAPEPGMPMAVPEREASYRAALRFALKDKQLTPDEERSLVVLAHDLGIPPRRAYELRDEMQREAKPR